MNNTDIKEISQQFSINISSFEKQKPYNEYEFLDNIENRENILITIGDSWTWGDSLSEALKKPRIKHVEYLLKKTNHDSEIRKKSTYGYFLSQTLNADWMNFALPGFSNRYIAERFKQVIENKELFQKYNKVYIILCLTETGREIEEWENPSWFDDCKTLEQLLIKSEKYIIDYLYQIYGNNDLNKLLIVRNFTNSFSDTAFHTKNLKNWIEINHQDNIELFPTIDLNFVGPATTNGWKFLEKNVYRNRLTDLERDFIKFTEDFKKIQLFFEKSSLHNKKGNRHPTIRSHQLWANYLYKNLTSS